MSYLVQSHESDIKDEVTNRLFDSTQKLCDFYNMLDCMPCSDVTIYSLTDIGRFDECVIDQNGSRSVDEFDHFDLWLEIKNKVTGDILGGAWVQEH